ncbi:MAG: KEOPS complex subunit Pcc1 [Candidatus Thermoplasmatota archaeon]
MKKATLAFSEIDSIDALEALRPEAEEGMKRVEIDISTDPARIDIEAQDTRALRASLNSYLRWLDISNKITTEYNK